MHPEPQIKFEQFEIMMKMNDIFHLSFPVLCLIHDHDVQQTSRVKAHCRVKTITPTKETFSDASVKIAIIHMQPNFIILLFA